MRNVRGTIVRITDTHITIQDGPADEQTFPYIGNGDFNHSYTGEFVALGVNDAGVAVECNNDRHIHLEIPGFISKLKEWLS